MSQLSFSTLDYAAKKTKREVFLAEMSACVPWAALEALSGDRAGQHSIRINQQWRACFRWQDGDAFDVEIVDYH